MGPRTYIRVAVCHSITMRRRMIRFGALQVDNVYGLWLAQNSPKTVEQSKARQITQNHVYLTFSSQRQVRCEAGESQWMGSWHVWRDSYLVFECTCFWHQSDQVYLFLAKILFYKNIEKRRLWVRPMGGWNSNLQAAWYLRHAHWARLCYVPFICNMVFVNYIYDMVILKIGRCR